MQLSDGDREQMFAEARAALVAAVRALTEAQRADPLAGAFHLGHKTSR